MCWWLLGRIGVARLADRFWLTILFGFSTQILWVTTRGGVWHTGHLIATILTFACLIELFGRRRAFLVGLLAGAAFLTRAPLAFAVLFYALLLEPGVARQATRGGGRLRRAGGRPCAVAVVGLAGARFVPSIIAFLLYNQVRFGTPFESGYALATLPPFLEEQRAKGLFSLAHVPDEPRVLPAPPAPSDRDAAVLPAGRPGDVGAADESRAAVRHAGGLATAAGVVAPGRGRGRADPDAPVLRRRLAPVRLPLLPRLRAVRDRRCAGWPPSTAAASLRCGWR